MALNKIAFIINDTDFFLSHRISLVKACEELFETVVILPKSEKNQAIRDMGFKVVEYPLQKTGINPFAELLTIYKIFRILRNEKPNYVHNFTIKPALYGSLASRWAGVQNIIVTITGLGYVYVTESKKGSILRPVINSLYRWAMQTPKVRVIFQNPDDKALFLQQDFIPNKRTTIIPGSGVDPKRFFPQPTTKNSDVVSILVPCRMLWDKGVGDIVKAFQQLKSKNVKLILAGKTDPANPASIPESQLQEWAQHNSIEWLGHVSDMNSLYNSADIVCLPSYREGLPLSLLEASLCEKAIITTDVPGCNYLIQNGVNGLVVSAKSPVKLREALLTLIENEKLRVALASNARRIALDKYTSESINKQILKFYNLNVESKSR